MKKNKLIVIGAVAIVCGVAGLLAGQALRPAPAVAPAPLAARPAGPVGALYAQTMKDSKGVPQALSQWQGKPLVVNFWAPWCAPCVEEMPELSTLATAQAAKGVNVIGIGIDSPSNIAQFSAKLAISYPLYVAGMSGTDLARELGNTTGGLPFTVLIGADGKVKKTYVARLKFAELQADLAAL